MRNRYDIQGDTTLICVYYHSNDLKYGRPMAVAVDTADLPKLLEKRCTWYANPARKSRTKFYAQAKFYDSATKKTRSVSMHRFLMDEPPGLDVHHVDNDGLNNRRRNLEPCAHIDNQRKHRQDPAYWEAVDAEKYRRAKRRRELAAVRKTVASTGFTRQYVWMVRTGKRKNAAVVESLACELDGSVYVRRPLLANTRP
jgi:hypothetical protein